MLLRCSLLLALACTPPASKKVRGDPDPNPNGPLDLDGDGATGEADCDDNDPDRSTLLDEIYYNGIDDDCDPLTVDDDLDGDGDPEATDCDDFDPLRHAAATEQCNELDDDCDGLIDDDDPSLDPTGAPTYWPDLDGDGLGDPLGVTAQYCAPQEGWSTDATDCDDSDPSILGPVQWIRDRDLDGFGAGPGVGNPDCEPPDVGWERSDSLFDCDDGDPTVYPDAPETCLDGVDSNCDNQECWTYEEDFEGGALPSDFDTSGDVLWRVGGFGFDFTDAARVDNLAQGETADLSIDLTWDAPGTLEFITYVDCRTATPCLRLYIDGTEMGAWSAPQWSQTTLQVPAGTWHVQWRAVDGESAKLDDIRAENAYVTPDLVP